MDAVVGAQSADVVIRTLIRSPCTKVMMSFDVYAEQARNEERKIKNIGQI